MAHPPQVVQEPSHPVQSLTPAHPQPAASGFLLLKGEGTTPPLLSHMDIVFPPASSDGFGFFSPESCHRFALPCAGASGGGAPREGKDGGEAEDHPGGSASLLGGCLLTACCGGEVDGKGLWRPGV